MVEPQKKSSNMDFLERTLNYCHLREEQYESSKCGKKRQFS